MTSFKRVFSRQAIAALALGCATLASAAELKIGFVNTDRIFKEAATAKAAQSKLLSRTQARVALGGLNRLIDDDEVGVI